MSHELLSAIIVASAACMFAGLERLFPYRTGQKLFRKHFFTDWLWFSILFGYLMGLVTFKLLVPGVDGVTGIRGLQLMRDWPIWGQLLFFFITHELFIYWFHRAMHANKYLWRIHEAHHSPEEIDWAAGSRANVIEAVITGFAEFGPILLLGAAPEVAIYKGTIDAIWGMFIHSNLNVRLGVLQYVINGPQMHLWHHSKDVHDINFATKLAIWDWIFGTAYLPEEKPKRWGVSGFKWPTNLWQQQMSAFRPFDETAEASAELPPEAQKPAA